MVGLIFVDFFNCTENKTEVGKNKQAKLNMLPYSLVMFGDRLIKINAPYTRLIWKDPVHCSFAVDRREDAKLFPRWHLLHCRALCFSWAQELLHGMALAASRCWSQSHPGTAAAHICPWARGQLSYAAPQHEDAAHPAWKNLGKTKPAQPVNPHAQGTPIGLERECHGCPTCRCRLLS